MPAAASIPKEGSGAKTTTSTKAASKNSKTVTPPMESVSSNGTVNHKKQQSRPLKKANPNEGGSAKNKKGGADNLSAAAATAAATAVLKIKKEPSLLHRSSKSSEAASRHHDDDVSADANRRYCLSPINSSTLPAGDEKKQGGTDDENDYHLTKSPNMLDKLPLDDDDDFVPQSPPRSSSAGMAPPDCSTPTDFAVDYGKSGSSFDTTSNVLAWLQSPTANGLFSPGGGLGSLMNSPPLRTPRTSTTPTVSSTSFFFSDVASLPKTGDGATSPKQAGGANNNNSKKRGISNIICISPLASTRGGTLNGSKTPENKSLSNSGHHSSNTPMLNFKDIFASPRERALPLLDDGDTPARPPARRPKNGSGTRDPNIDSVHLAERELLEDEDLSVLLQLASNHTPVVSDGAAARDANAPVFRSPSKGDEDFPGNLELPMIGDNAEKEGETRKARLAQKKSENGLLLGKDDDGFGPPTLGMRSSSTSQPPKGTKGASAANEKNKSKKQKSSASAAGSKKDKSKDRPDEATSSSDKNIRDNSSLKSSSSGSISNGNPYPNMGHSYPPVHGDMHGYYPLPSGMPPMPPGASGSMRVVMGGPPPRRNGGNGKPGSPATRPPGASSPPPPPPGYHEYPPPPGNMPYPPRPPGMFPSYPSYNGMSRYPPTYSHYPPPPPCQMPMYNAQHPPGTSGSAKEPKRGKNTKGGKPQGKRSAPPSGPDTAAAKPGQVLSSNGPAPPVEGPPGQVNKKQKKSPGGQAKRKNKSPPLTDRADRDKAAATIKAVNAASGGKNDRAAALAAAILRGVTMRPSGKWQAQLYFAGKSRYIGVFDTREKAALAYEIAREKLKSGPADGTMTPKSTENLVNAARKAAFEGVNEKLPK